MRIRSSNSSLDISGHPNTSGNDGTITRFGWKAQNKSLECLRGEAYNVEMGVTNEAFPNERGNAPASCLYNQTPEDSTNFNLSGAQIPSDMVAIRGLHAVSGSACSARGRESRAILPFNPSRTGRKLFSQVHCDLCHTPSLQTGKSSYQPSLSYQSAALFSDLLVHNMGSGLADQISQGAAGPDEFRTAPLWGVGQRIFFLHDGRATPANGGLLQGDPGTRQSGLGSEWRDFIIQGIGEQQKQDLLNFLRSL